MWEMLYYHTSFSAFHFWWMLYKTKMNLADYVSTLTVTLIWQVLNMYRERNDKKWMSSSVWLNNDTNFFLQGIGFMGGQIYY